MKFFSSAVSTERSIVMPPTSFARISSSRYRTFSSGVHVDLHQHPVQVEGLL